MLAMYSRIGSEYCPHTAALGQSLKLCVALCPARCLQDRFLPVWWQLLQLCTDSEVCGDEARQLLARHTGEGVRRLNCRLLHSDQGLLQGRRLCRSCACACCILELSTAGEALA
jgi:hypothetical protein